MIVLHHLETSRSSRVIWLLEALGLEYELVTHKRGVNSRSGADLVAVHPLGKAPVLVDGALVLVESSAILRYLDERYGGGRFSPPSGSDAHALHDQWLDYAEGSLMGPALMRLLGLMGGAGLPPMLDQFSAGELEKALNQVASGVEPGPFLMGAALTLADIQMSYCLALLGATGMLRGKPALERYWARLQEEPGFQRAVELGGPLVSLNARS